MSRSPVGGSDLVLLCTGLADRVPSTAIMGSWHRIASTCQQRNAGRAVNNVGRQGSIEKHVSPDRTDFTSLRKLGCPFFMNVLLGLVWTRQR